MSYASVDALQKILAENVFHYAIDKKKAAGRALGTLVEVIAFYLLRSWDFRDSVAIELPIPEYLNPSITHNVEYSIHPIIEQKRLRLPSVALPLTASKIRKAFWQENRDSTLGDRTNQLLSASGILRNSCTIAESPAGLYVAHLDLYDEKATEVSVSLLYRRPYAIFECKRVGVEEGSKKGPQTIEKAKQGAYVARTVSSLQKVRMKDGRIGGLIHPTSGKTIFAPYDSLLTRIVESTSGDLLRDFVLTVGVVSNHGNWFTSQNHNKELRVLAQSYDWLLFLTDGGLADFVSELLLDPAPELKPAREAFLASYTGQKGNNRFTKVQMDELADKVLVRYFDKHAERIAGWFNIITPSSQSLNGLRSQLTTLSGKNWKEIHGL